MNTEAANLSGSLALRGVLAILFGAAAVFWPGITLVTFVYLFAAYILINGVIDVVFGIGKLFGEGNTFWTRVLTLLAGVIQVGVGVYLLRHPQVGFATLVLLVGFVLIARGVFDVVEGLFEENSGGYRALLIIGGLLAALAGVVMLFQPVKAGVAFVWILGVYALITGPLMIALAMQVKNENKRVAAKR